MALKHIAPNPALMRELKQVSTHATDVLETLEALNAIPGDFPTEEVRDLCLSLRDLKDGTDEGSRSQLESARNKLPKWRREHFYVEEEFAADDEVLRFYRGMHLDRTLNLLLVSTTTALDEYRAQAQEHFDDTVRAEETLQPDSHGSIPKAIEETLEVENKVAQSKAEIDDRLDPENERVDLLKRRLTDSANLARVARSE